MTNHALELPHSSWCDSQQTSPGLRPDNPIDGQSLRLLKRAHYRCGPGTKDTVNR
jgi:hypothetical protein